MAEEGGEEEEEEKEEEGETKAGSSAACVCATEMLTGDASIASVLAPSRERAWFGDPDFHHELSHSCQRHSDHLEPTSAKMPPPHPTSRTSLPSSHRADGVSSS